MTLPLFPSALSSNTLRAEEHMGSWCLCQVQIKPVELRAACVRSEMVAVGVGLSRSEEEAEMAPSEGHGSLGKLRIRQLRT